MTIYLVLLLLLQGLPYVVIYCSYSSRLFWPPSSLWRTPFGLPCIGLAIPCVSQHLGTPASENHGPALSASESNMYVLFPH